MKLYGVLGHLIDVACVIGTIAWVFDGDFEIWFRT